MTPNGVKHLNQHEEMYLKMSVSRFCTFYLDTDVLIMFDIKPGNYTRLSKHIQILMN